MGFCFYLAVNFLSLFFNKWDKAIYQSPLPKPAKLGVLCPQYDIFFTSTGKQNNKEEKQDIIKRVLLIIVILKRGDGGVGGGGEARIIV